MADSWIPGLVNRKPTVVEAFCRHAQPRLLAFARRLLRGVPTRESDEEDVVNAALFSFLRRAADHQFQLADEDDLWKVVQTIVARKALNHRRRQRRRPDQVDGEIEPVCMSNQVEQAETRELLFWLKEQLGDEELVKIADLKLEQHTNVEIAAELGRSVATIERRVKLIRSQWIAAIARQEDES
ncbi:MAG: sigma-70 family RNA polymerase sigma factor [Planctomycetales bacterium]|nr:sigma-70 family RNA polymerase sigma factor [Planctomycetales bacterium]